MNEERRIKLMEKYLAGSSSLNEEKELFDNNTLRQENESWFDYIDNQKIKAPRDLNQDLWNKSSINTRQVRIKGSILLLIAACITLLFVFNNNSTTDSDYEKKSQQLKEAIAFMNAGQQETKQKEILVKDELVTIYLSYD